MILENAAPAQPAELDCAITHREAGRYKEATLVLQSWLADKPQDASACALLAQVLSLDKQDGRAWAALNTALSINPALPIVQRNRARLLLKQQKPVEALQAAQAAYQSDATDPENQLVLATALGANNQNEQAFILVERALQSRLDYAEAFATRALLKLRVNDLAGALVDAEKCLAIKPHLGQLWGMLGSLRYQLKNLSGAIDALEKALEYEPDNVGCMVNLGGFKRQAGAVEDAIVLLEKAVAIAPDNVGAWVNLGAAFQQAQRVTEAKVAYAKALEIAPEQAAVASNLGILAKEEGSWEEALRYFNQALEIKPDFAEAHNNLGSALKDMGRPDEAEASYRRALKIKPDYIDALNNLASLLYGQGKSTMALKMALKIALNTIKQPQGIEEAGEAKSIFVACVKHLRFKHDDNEMRIALVRALTEPWGRPSELARCSADFIKFNHDIGGCVTRAANAWPVRLPAQELFPASGLALLADDKLLCALLNSAPICDIEMERFLTMARCAMLDAATGIAVSEGTVGTDLNFYSALARQCFINEYVFCHTDDEIQKASDLRDSLAAALAAKTPVPALWLVAVAAYFPLGFLPLATRLLDGQWPEAVAAVLVQQVSEPEEELQIRATIPRLTNIEDEASLLVQGQYEENPYPRWIKAAPAGKANNIVEYLSRKFPLSSFKRHCKRGNIDVLIAGCGTGQHSIGTAQRIQGAQVLAVDLSLNSLGYAKRKTRELGLTSIEYAQADLLKLGLLGRSFDVIESSGVLHHLADPWAGWRVLLSLLRPGGFMKLGFYSEVARRNIVRIRTFIAEQGYGATAEDIRRCRQELVDLNKSADFGSTLKSGDFFSMSACRDLLFHVQEHRMTLAGIDAFLRENNLAFLGFEIDAGVLHAYKRRFPDDRAATNLGQWQIFENENPDTFFGMYQFWIQKTG